MSTIFLAARGLFTPAATQRLLESCQKLSLLSKVSGRRVFHRSTSIGGDSARFRNTSSRGKNPSNSSGRVLLDKFVKHVAYDGALVIRAPFTVQVRGSYFNQNNNVDRDMNQRMMQQYREQHDASVVMLQRGTQPTLQDMEESCPSSTFLKKSNEAVEQVELEKLAGIVSNHLSNSLDEGRFCPSSPGCEDEAKTSPLHILLYGRSSHRIDSYSVINPSTQHHSYAYLSDATSMEEVGSMFEQYHFSSSTDEAIVSSPDSYSSTAHFSVWHPKVGPIENENGSSSSSSHSLTPGEGESLASALKIFSLRHIVESYDSALKSVCLLPTLMSKIFIQGDLGAHIHLDGTLIEDLRKVGLSTEVGNIRVKDVTAEEITLSSRMGDISCDGVVDGKIIAETYGDGDFVAKGTGIYGPSLIASTNDGDISLWSEIRSEECLLSTKNGHITCRDINGSHVTLLVSEAGNVFANINGGSISATVTNGSVQGSVKNITEDSVITVTKGDVFVSIPTKCRFKLKVSAPMTEIAPKLQNTGELSLSKETGFEEFSTVDASSEPIIPTLTISAYQGTVHVSVFEADSNEVSALGFFETS